MLSLMMSIPVFGAFLLTMIRFGKNSLFIKVIPLSSSLLSFLINIALLVNFNSAVSINFLEYWFGMKLGVDGISLVMLSLTTFLFPICIMVSLKQIKESSIQSLMALFLVLESLVIGVFVATDIIMFYVFFESMLIPIFFIIGLWGHQTRVYASFKLFLYTLAGSVLFLISLIYMYTSSGGVSDIERLSSMTSKFNLPQQCWLWCGCFLAFAVKLPMIPLHTWLPDAHVQAPTGGSMILAGILIKAGGYGILRILLPMLPDASIYFADLVIVLSIIAIIYTSMIACVQTNIKKLIAYSSIAHMGFVTVGLFSLNEYGISGAVFQMLSHGIISSALFLCIGILYDREHTFNIFHYAGLMRIIPVFSIVFIILSMASIGVPGTSGFVGEFLAILGTFGGNDNHIITTAFVAFGIVVGAVYTLSLCKRIVWGIAPEFLVIRDLDKLECAILTILVALILFLGLFPNIIIDLYLKSAITNLLSNSFHFVT